MKYNPFGKGIEKDTDEENKDISDDDKTVREKANNIESTEPVEQYESTWVDKSMTSAQEHSTGAQGWSHPDEPNIDINPDAVRNDMNRAAEVRSVEEFESLNHLHGDGGESINVPGVEFDM